MVLERPSKGQPFIHLAEKPQEGKPEEMFDKFIELVRKHTPGIETPGAVIDLPEGEAQDVFREDIVIPQAPTISIEQSSVAPLRNIHPITVPVVEIEPIEE
jgi:hypothetical protein